MWEAAVEFAREHGVWAALFVGLLVWCLREIRRMHGEQLAAKDEEIRRLLEENRECRGRYDRMTVRFTEFADKMARKGTLEK